MQKQKINIFLILSFFFILKAEQTGRIAIFPFLSSGIDIDSSFIFVDLLRKEVSKSNQYDMVEYADMKKTLSYYGYKGKNLCYDDECALVMGKFLSVKKIVQGFLKRRRNTFTLNIRFIDLEKEEILLDVTEKFKGTFEELLTNKIPKFAEMINWSTKYLHSVNYQKNNKKNYPSRKGDKKIKFRVLFGFTSLVTAGGGAVMNYLAEKKIKEYTRIEEEYRVDDSEEQYTSLNKRYEDAYKSANQRMMIRNVLYSLAGTGLTCFSITFFF